MGFIQNLIFPRHPFYGRNGVSKRFVILTYPRTGSHQLIFGLRNTGNVVSYGELFSEVDKSVSLYPGYDIPKRIIKVRNNDPEKFLNYIFSGYNDSIKAVGFKLNYYQSGLFAEKGIFSILNEKFGVSWIHLKRRNVVKNYISYQLLQKTNVCFAVNRDYEKLFSGKTDKYISGDSLEKYRPKINVSAEEMISFILKTEKETNEQAERIGNAPCTDIYYEDFMFNFNKAVQHISLFLFNDEKFLSIKESSPEPIMKLNTAPMSDVVENFEELKIKLSGTPYLEMLEEK